MGRVCFGGGPCRFWPAGQLSARHPLSSTCAPPSLRLGCKPLMFLWFWLMQLNYTSNQPQITPASTTTVNTITFIFETPTKRTKRTVELTGSWGEKANQLELKLMQASIWQATKPAVRTVKAYMPGEFPTVGLSELIDKHAPRVLRRLSDLKNYVGD